MAWSFASDRPVYIQLAERVTMLVISGQYSPGEQVPSVRQLALTAAVNPNTVQHAFCELEDSGVIVSKGTVGRFVTENLDVIEECRKKMAKRMVDGFLENIGHLNFSKEQIISMIEEEYK